MEIEITQKHIAVAVLILIIVLGFAFLFKKGGNLEAPTQNQTSSLENTFLKNFFEDLKTKNLKEVIDKYFTKSETQEEEQEYNFILENEDKVLKPQNFKILALRKISDKKSLLRTELTLKNGEKIKALFNLDILGPNKIKIKHFELKTFKEKVPIVPKYSALYFKKSLSFEPSLSQWKEYSLKEPFNFSFKYPAIYDKEKSCQLSLSKVKNGFYFLLGNTSFYFALYPKEKTYTLENFANSIKEDTFKVNLKKEIVEAKIEKEYFTEIDNREAIVLEGYAKDISGKTKKLSYYIIDWKKGILIFSSSDINKRCSKSFYSPLEETKIILSTLSMVKEN